MNTAAMDKAAKVLAKAYTGRSNAGVLGDILGQLLQALLSLLGGCLSKGASAAELLALARSDDEKDKRFVRVMTERSVRQDMRQKYGLFGYARRGGDKTVDTLILAAQDTSVSEQDVEEFAALAEYSL